MADGNRVQVYPVWFAAHRELESGMHADHNGEPMMTRCMAAIIAIALAGDPANCVAQQSSGQAAYGAISEIVRMLKADPSTDWRNVNVEALRQHLIDMNDVTMQSVVEQRNILGGIEVDVTGTSRTIAAIRRMTTSHSRTLEQGDEYHASVQEIPNGARLTVTAKNPSDPNVVARIRGLGFAGIMTEGEHHARHHIALARGEPMHGH